MLKHIQRPLREAVRFNSSRYRLHHVVADFASQAPPGSKVLDAGAGEAPFRPLFRHTHYQSADFTKVNKPYETPTYVCDLAAVPVIDGYYDYILFTQVLEHLPEPANVLQELQRLLRPGGKILITGPLFFEEHEQPYDFYRYTQYGFRYLIEKVGLSIERLEWLEGYYGTVGYQLNRIGQYLPWRPQNFRGSLERLLLPIFMAKMKIFCLLTSILFHRLELRYKHVATGYPKNYVVIASKRSAPQVEVTK